MKNKRTKRRKHEEEEEEEEEEGGSEGTKEQITRIKELNSLRRIK